MNECPHCESSNVEIREMDKDSPILNVEVYYQAVCKDCGVRGPESDTKESATDQWNNFT